MLRYFPFDQRFNDKMGTVPLTENNPLVEIDKHYVREVALKRQLLTEHPQYYYQTLPGYDPAQWEVLELVLTDLAKFSPGSFSLYKEGNRRHWINRELNEEITFAFGDAGSLPCEPLDWVGRQVQEDLVFLAGPDATLAGGQLCFANDWCLEDKIGVPFWRIHAPVTPIVTPMMLAAQKLMERLPPGRPFWRMNWSVKISNQLDMTSRHTKRLKQQLADLLPELTSDNIGDKLFVRVERQTLTRLPGSGVILFGIHTYQNLLANEAADPDRAFRMAQVFSTTPQAMLDYKNMTAFMSPLLIYLQQKYKTLDKDY